MSIPFPVVALSNSPQETRLSPDQTLQPLKKLCFHENTLR